METSLLLSSTVPRKAPGALLACCRRRRRGLPRLLLQRRFGAMALAGANKNARNGAWQALPNPSLKRSANGRPPGPVWRYAVHFHQPGPGVLPSSPA